MEELVAIARSSPLTALIERHVDRTGCLLEAGCGLGQYVLLLRERGLPAVGADWSFEAVREAARAGGPVAVMDLRTVAVRSGSVSTYLSLGVVEHDRDGPDAIVREAARVLKPGGTLLLSVPYWNGVRRIATPYLRRVARRTRDGGGEFYQYAFSRRELGRRLAAHGFAVEGFHPYDPGRMLRKAWHRLRGRRPASGPGLSGGPTATVHATQRGSRRAGGDALRRLARVLLYSEPSLRLLGHMVLAVAVRR